MSLYQCDECGCRENTACGLYWSRNRTHLFDWTGIDHLKGKSLCSACAPTKFRSGTPTEFGKWHGQFARIFLPIGQFKTNEQGDLEHIETGDTDIKKYRLVGPEGGEA